jgi:DNA-binding transcriptional ArsR family regulator
LCGQKHLSISGDLEIRRCNDYSTPVTDSIPRLKAEFFRMLGHPARVRLLELLGAGGERSVDDLQAALEMESSTTSQHLAALRKLGLVDSRKEGASVYYRLKDP